MSNTPRLIRLPIFALVLIFSFVVLGLDAYFVHQLHQVNSWFNDFGNGSPNDPNDPNDFRRSLQRRNKEDDALKGNWAKLGVAVSTITIASILPMLVIDLLRKGAPTSFVVVELGWLAVLWVLWLATAADTAFISLCSAGANDAPCTKYRVIEAFSFLTWILLMAYWAVLLVSAMGARNNGQSRIWFTSVGDADFSAGSGGVGGGPGVTSGGVGTAPYSHGDTGYPPKQQPVIGSHV